MDVAPTSGMAKGAMDAIIDVSRHREAVEVASDVHWIGALDPTLRTFDIILRTANGTTYNAYAIRGSEGVAIVDTVKREFSDEFFARLESVARYDEIRVIVLNHLEPDHSGALAGADASCAPGPALHLHPRHVHAQGTAQAEGQPTGLSTTPP